MHKNQFGQKNVKDGRREPYRVAYDKSRENFDLCRTKSFRSPGKSDLADSCSYCQAKGHWKNECPMLKAKAQYSVESKKIRNTALGTKSVGLVTSVQSSLEPAVENHCRSLAFHLLLQRVMFHKWALKRVNK